MIWRVVGLEEITGIGRDKTSERFESKKNNLKTESIMYWEEYLYI